MSSSRPNKTVAAAAQRNHHRARHVSLSSALLRAAGSISAYAGTCTKLKNQSSPIHITATMTCAIRKMPNQPWVWKISMDRSPSLEWAAGTYQTSHGSVSYPDAIRPNAPRDRGRARRPPRRLRGGGAGGGGRLWPRRRGGG